MKKWFVKCDYTLLQCILMNAFVSSSFRLKLQYRNSVFMAEFKDRNDYLDARDGGWRRVKIYTLNKKTIKWGIARFSEF